MAVLKTALIICCKKEEKNIESFLKYYSETVGVSKVFLCDNNDHLYAPDVRKVILPYIRSGYTEYRDYRGVDNAWDKCFTEIYSEIKNDFDWVCFFDINDYLYLDGFESIDAFLGQDTFKECGLVMIPEIRMKPRVISLSGNKSCLPERFSVPDINLLKKEKKIRMRRIVRCDEENAIRKVTPDSVIFDDRGPVCLLWNGEKAENDANELVIDDKTGAAKELLQYCNIHLKYCRDGSAEENDGTAFSDSPVNEKADRRSVCEQRMEELDRGLIAIKTDDGVFLSWRMTCKEDTVFGTAEEKTVYQVLRDGDVIAETTGRTNYTDAGGRMDSCYIVCSSHGDVSTEVRPFSSGSNYFDIPLERPPESPYGPYTINDVSAGDLDGDGAYELVVKWDSGGKDNSEPGYTGNVLIDAYKLDGTRLWKQPVDLGPNIRAGAHYTQFLVYDFDRDGKSEMMLKTAPGSRDGTGRFVSRSSRYLGIRFCDNDKDYRDERGMITEGDEFLTVFRGDTGEAADTIYYPNQRVRSDLWGDFDGNRSDRYTAAVAWIDGRKPYGFFMRGYYWGKRRPDIARQCACAVSFDGKRLRCRHSFDTYDHTQLGLGDRRKLSSFDFFGRYKGVSGYSKGNELYIGEGNHNCIAADVDGDGRDEVLTGPLCYHLDARDRLNVRWCSFLGHGDAMHIGAYDPESSGYDLMTIYENGGTHPVTGSSLDHGMSVMDASTGEMKFFRGSTGDMGRGMMADIGAGGRYQIWGLAETETKGEYVPVTPWIRTDEGFEESVIPGVSSNFRIYWDGDLYDELLDGGSGCPLEITSWNGSEMERIFITEGCVSINGTKANPCFQADILGDWREELVMAREDNEALRVFVSDIPTEYSLMTLMHDPVYRAGVAAEQTAYNQPPHIGFCLTRKCFEGDVKKEGIK